MKRQLRYPATLFTMKKIMFDTKYGLEQAVLAGTKTMTRRIIPDNLQNTVEACSKGVLIVPETSIPADMSIEQFAEQWSSECGRIMMRTHEEPEYGIQYIDALQMVAMHSKYQKGDIVAIAQSYSTLCEGLKWEDEVKLHQKIMAYYPDEYAVQDLAGWSNKMFVHSELMPNQIFIDDLKLERLQDISEEDCLKEGIKEFGDRCTFKGWETKEGGIKWASSPREAYAALIELISGKGTWDKNPWTFAYEFELVK